MNEKIRVLIADDHIHERRGFISLLNLDQSIEVVGEAASVREAIEMAQRLLPDVVLLDLKWFKDTTAGAQAIFEIKANAPDVKILAATVHPELINDARKAGAEVAIDKDLLFNGETLVARIQDAYKTGKLLSVDPLTGEDLSSRESDVLQLMAAGLTNKAIGNELKIAETTVKKHVRAILDKFKASSRTEAVSTALSHGIINRPVSRQETKDLS